MLFILPIMTDQVHVHETWISMQPCSPRKSEETWKFCASATPASSGNLKKTKTCVAKQLKLPQEILKKLKSCAPLQPVLPQEILKKPKTHVPV